MSSLNNFHQAITTKVTAGDLQLGVSKMAGADPHSIASSRFWTLFPYLFTIGYAGTLWAFAYPWWWYILGVPITWFFAVFIRQKKGMQKARRLAMSDSLAFDLLWDEGALTLRIPGSEVPTCMSPTGDYRQFMVQHFLLSR
ncbi:MAG: hypothetical protein OYH76_18720 [Defluviicoccus sp.]|nr:hypothetical protein [Defluviicoccus sp.]MDE0277933.1 hypothetical protein [Defluviicoccus sp.]